MNRSSQRVEFPGGSGFLLSGIVDSPISDAKASVLFTHCFTCNKDLKAIVRISRNLAAAGYLVLRYDLTGLGGSQGDFSHTDFSSNQADLRAAFDFMSSQLAPPRFLVGHSFGAACSLSMAQELDSVQAIASLAGPSDTSHLASLLERMDPQIATTGQGTVSIGGKSYTIRKEMLADFRKHDLPATLRQLEKPVMLFHSPSDETLGYEHALRLFSFLTQRNHDDQPPAPTSLITLQDADHLLMQNPADIEFVSNCLACWFDRILSNEPA